MSIIENNNNESNEIEVIKHLVNEGRIDDSVQKIGKYINQSTDEDYLERLENVLEVLTAFHAGRTVIRFLIENLMIDIPSILTNLAKVNDSLLRYQFLLLLKSMCENESDLFLPSCEEMLNSDDPNVREAELQLIIFMAGGDPQINEEIIKTVATKLKDEKDYVVEKAVQALKAIGAKSSSVVTKILTNYIKEYPEDKVLEERINAILKAIVTVEKIEEIVEDEEKEMSLEEIKPTKEIKTAITLTSDEIKMIEEKIEKKKLVLIQKENELEKKKATLKNVEKEFNEMQAQQNEKELEFKKKELELAQKHIELEEREKKLEEKKIKQKEETLQQKKELLEKQKELAKVELEIKKRSIEEELKSLEENTNKKV